MVKNRHSYFAWLAAIAVITGLAILVKTTSAYPPEIVGGGGGWQLKTPVGFERWWPHPAPEPSTVTAPGAGWFYRNNLTLNDININYPMMGFRAVDVEVESWGTRPRLSAVFVQNTGLYEASHWFVTIGTEQAVRDMLFGGQYQNYRMMDLEVHQYGQSTPSAGKRAPEEVSVLPDEICALLVANEGDQSTPAWDFIVYATPIDLFVWEESFESSMRLIDHEISLNAAESHANQAEYLDFVLYSQIVVFDEGIEHVESTIFQFSSDLQLMELEEAGWQLIDSERNIPLMLQALPQFYGTFTGLFVLKPNAIEFYQEQEDYSLFPAYSTEAKRMIDLELVPEGNGQFLLDETYLLYQ